MKIFRAAILVFLSIFFSYWFGKYLIKVTPGPTLLMVWEFLLKIPPIELIDSNHFILRINQILQIPNKITALI